MFWIVSHFAPDLMLSNKYGVKLKLIKVPSDWSVQSSLWAVRKSACQVVTAVTLQLVRGLTYNCSMWTPSPPSSPSLSSHTPRAPSVWQSSSSRRGAACHGDWSSQSERYYQVTANYRLADSCCAEVLARNWDLKKSVQNALYVQWCQSTGPQLQVCSASHSPC